MRFGREDDDDLMNNHSIDPDFLTEQIFHKTEETVSLLLIVVGVAPHLSFTISDVG